MNIITFKNPKIASYIGRNGFGKQIGLEVLPIGNRGVTLYPINSKGDVANCCMDIPLADIPSVIKALKAAKNSLLTS